MGRLQEIIRVLLAERHGQLYADEKVMDLDGKSHGDILAWVAVYLDPRNQLAFARRVGIDPECLSMLRRVLDTLKNAK